MEALTAFILITAIGNFSLGIFILFQNLKSSLNRSFGLFAIITGIWVFTNFIFEVVHKEFFLRSAYSIGALVPLAGFIWIYFFDKTKLSRLDKIIISILSVIGLFFFAAPYFSDFIIVTIKPVITMGSLFGVYAAYIYSIILIALIKVYVIFLKSEGIKKEQSKYILFGLGGFGLISIFVSMVLPSFKIITFSRLDSPSSIFFILFSTYAILRHHLFNIKVIATELLTFTIWIFLLTRVFLAETLRDQIIDGTLLILVVLFGILLIKSVVREVEQREKLEVLNKKLEELNRLKSEFLSFASHQVKAPMAIVKGFAQLIYDGTLGLVPDKVKESAKKIVNSANKMIALVENLLDMRKIDEGKMEYNFTEVEITKLVNGVVEELRPMAQDKNLDLTFTGLANEIKIKADPQKLSQVFQNFVDNAIKYTDQGWIKVKVEAKENSVLIVVSDSGRGLSQKLQPHLFEQFSRDSETAKEIQGTGLGLYIAKQIVEAHHGKIWAESEGDGKGSTFFVEIPIK